MSKTPSPMIQTLTDYGTNFIISLKNDDINTATTLLKSMVNNVNQYHESSLYAIQYDVYNYMKNMKNMKKPVKQYVQNTSNDITLHLKREPNVKIPNEKIISMMIDNTEYAEEYVNNLIAHVKEFEKKLCKQRREYLLHNHNKLINIAKYKEYDMCNSNKLKQIVKTLVTID